MAIIPLNDSQSCVNFFHESILFNLQYWQTSTAIRSEDIPKLDQEQAGIIRAITFGLEIDEAWPSIRELIISLSPYMEKRGYGHNWASILSRAFAVAPRLGDTGGSMIVSLLLARLEQRYGNFKPAIKQYRQAIRLARKIGDEYNQARAYSNLGFLYTQLGYWRRAEIVCCHALAVFERLNSDHGRAHTENHLGSLYTWQCRWDLARLHFERASDIWRAMGDDHGLMYGLMNLGLLYNDIERPDEALPYLEKAVEQARRTGEEIQIANIYMNIGVSYRLKGELDRAEIYTEQAERIFRRFSNLLGLAQVQDNLGLICLSQHKWTQARKHLETALQAWRDLGNSYAEIRTLGYMVEYELARKDVIAAIEQLAEIERHIYGSGQTQEAPHWQVLLTKYRRSLNEHLAQQAAADRVIAAG